MQGRHIYRGDNGAHVRRKMLQKKFEPQNNGLKMAPLINRNT